MNLFDSASQVTQAVVDYVPTLLAAVGVLIIGWLVALIVRRVVYAALQRTELDNRLTAWISGGGEARVPESEKLLAGMAYYIVMGLVLLGFFEVLGLRIVTEPLNRFLTEIFEYAPRLVAPAILLAAAWALATGLRFAIRRGLDATTFEDRLAEEAGLSGKTTASDTIADTVYWLVFLIFLPAILGALGLQGLLGPVESMVESLLGFLPSLLAAAAIFVAGWLVARIVQRVVTGLLSASGADGLGERAGLANVLKQRPLSEVIGLIVYVLILVPVAISALNALRLEAITRPASQMLETMLQAIPGIFGAFLVLGIAYVAGKLAAGLATSLLAGIGFDNVLADLGLGKATGNQTPSTLAGHLMLVGIMLFATIEAADLIGFAVLSRIITDFTVFVGQVVMAIVIFGIGLYLAQLAARTIAASGSRQAHTLAIAARVAILVLSGSMALRELGLASEIVNMAFGILLAAVAVAAAISFGLGGRDLAARELESWREAVRRDE